jgi:signal peptidase I
VTSPSPEPAALAPRRKVRRRKFEQWFGPKGAGIVEWIVVIVGAVVLALVFLLQAFYIPSLSMYPTLDKGDRVLVNKLSYKVHDVNRGDIIVFERPPSEAPSDIPDLIKRVIGLPGEAVAFENGSVYINGERLPESYLPDGTTTTAANAPNNCTTTSPCIVPSGQVWVMGDNRGDSKDSRYFGAIPESSIVGRAFILVWPFSRFGLL